jgi:hypothetical protein
MSQTFLTLAPDQGGTRFGPFTGTINLGSDASRCQLVLQAGMGIEPIHALVTDSGAGWQVQPAAFGCLVYLRKPNGRVLSVNTGVQASEGDTIVLGSQAGPALTLARAGVTAPGPAPGAKPGFSVPGAQNLSGNAFAREARRQAEASLITTPYGREAYRWWTRFRSGALMRPRYIIGAVVAVLGFFGLGCFTCFGAVAAWMGLR